MKTSRIVAAFAFVFIMTAATSMAAEPVDYVNPYIGTTGTHPTEYGGMIPSVAPPFAMTQWSPMTRLNKIGRMPYNYKDDHILGFIGTHHPAIWMGDYGYVSIMPGSGHVRATYATRKARFRHEDETVKPNYYSVVAGGVGTEIAATTRASIMRFEFPADEQAWIVVDATRNDGYEGAVKIEPDRSVICGRNSDRHSAPYGPPLSNFNGYFYIEINAPLKEYGTYEGERERAGSVEETGDRVGAYAVMDLDGGREAMVRIGTSFISVEQARENLEKEIPSWDFDAVRQKGRSAWNEQLSRIEVEGGDDDMKTIFYTAMYHAHLQPRVFSEYGLYYSAFDDKVHDGVSYNDYSLWDTFRALHPLLIFTASDRVDDMVTSLLQMYKEGGWLPKWPNPTYTGIMIGSHADSVIADAYLKGFRGFDAELAYKAVYKNAMVPPDGDETDKWTPRFKFRNVESRGGLTWYKKYGYVASDKTWESVSRTLEFAYDDFCIAQFAKALGKMDDYEMFMERSKNYRNLYHKGFMRARKSNGRFTFTVPYKDITEGRKWTYLFCVMHDVPGLIELMGGNDAFAARLDKAFGRVLFRPRYRHNNEPSHHYAYLYDYAGMPWKTQERTRMAAKKNYFNTPDGLSGNDDCGQMSAWYIFTSIGFYPVAPGSDVYAIGSPMWDKATIHVGEPFEEAAFAVITENQSDDNVYIQSATLNGKPYNSAFIRHGDIASGGELRFVMGPEPNLEWGTEPLSE